MSVYVSFFQRNWLFKLFLLFIFSIQNFKELDFFSSTFYLSLLFNLKFLSDNRLQPKKKSSLVSLAQCKIREELCFFNLS